MSKITWVKDILENNGKTIFQNNMETKHRLSVGAKVHFANGKNYIISELTRDCDGTPLYTLQEYVTHSGELLRGISEEEVIENL